MHHFLKDLSWKYHSAIEYGPYLFRQLPDREGLGDEVNSLHEHAVFCDHIIGIAEQEDYL
jgi:hypothetical protein